MIDVRGIVEKKRIKKVVCDKNKISSMGKDSGWTGFSLVFVVKLKKLTAFCR